MTRPETDVLHDWDTRTRLGDGLRVRENILFGLLADTARDCGEALEEWPAQAVVTGGSPWGFQIAVGTQLEAIDGARSAVGFFAALEIDLLRLTVMRQGTTERWWYNPAPAGGHADRSP